MGNNNDIMVESLVLSSIFSDMSLIDEYPLKDEHFKNSKTKFFFQLAKGLSSYRELTEYTVATWIGQNRSLERTYENYGGWKAIENVIKLGNASNFDKYVDDLFKQNLISDLKDKGFNVDKNVVIEGNEVKPKDLFIDFTSEQVYQFYELLLNDASVNTNSSDMVLEDLFYSNEDIQKKLRKEDNNTSPFDVTMTYELNGEEKIFRPLKLLNDSIDGISAKQGIYYFTGSSGSCKSTLVFNIALGLIESGNKVFYVTNEMTADYFREILICYVSAIVFKCYSLTRRKINHMDLTDEEYDVFKKANNFIKEKYENKLYFMSVADFNVEKILKMTKKLNLAYGVDTLVLETFKSEDTEDTVNNMLMNSRALDRFAKKNDIKVILPAQTRTADEGVISYLTSASISGSKQIKEVAHTITIQRKITKEELDPNNKKMFLQPFKWAKSEETGKYYKKFLKIKSNDEEPVIRRSRRGKIGNTDDSDKHEEYINPDDKLILLFVDKCRSANDQDKILIMKVDGERGICSFVAFANHVFTGRLKGY